jgi:hypothetical protein
MTIKTRFISADDHVIEHPRVWTDRLSKQKWGDRIPHLERQPDGSDSWTVDGVRLGLLGEGSVGALMADRGTDPRTWDEVPQAAYLPAERLKALDARVLTTQSSIRRSPELRVSASAGFRTLRWNSIASGPTTIG